MIKVPVLAVLTDGQGTILELEIEAKKEGKGQLFFDARLTMDEMARKALIIAFNLLKAGNTDILVRLVGEKDFCLCSGSFALPMYLGMHACVWDMKLKQGIYATGCLDEKGQIGAVAELAEKIRVILGKAKGLIVPKNQGLPVEGIEIKEVENIQDAVEFALSKPTIGEKVFIYGTDT